MIAVTGTGRVTWPPDVVRVRVTATALRPTVADAIAAADATVAAVRATLARRAVTGADAASGAFTVGAEQVWTPEGRPQVTGYRCEHEVRVTLRAPSAVGAVLGDVLAAGGDGVRLDGVEPALDDDGAARVRARELAWADAVDRASRLAALAGRDLGLVQQIVEDGAPAQPLPRMLGEAAGLAKASADLGVRPGDVAVTVVLAVQFGLGEPR